MRKQNLMKAAVFSASAISSIASADVSVGCLQTFTDCKNIELQSVGLINVTTCHYNPKALAPAEPPGAIQCEFNVSYKCDGLEKTNVVLSPARFGCTIER